MNAKELSLEEIDSKNLFEPTKEVSLLLHVRSTQFFSEGFTALIFLLRFLRSDVSVKPKMKSLPGSRALRKMNQAIE